MSTWDVIVIGGGPAGENAEEYAVKGSRRAAVIVEADQSRRCGTSLMRTYVPPTTRESAVTTAISVR